MEKPPIDLDIAEKFAAGESGAQLGRKLGIGRDAIYGRLNKFARRWAPADFEAERRRQPQYGLRLRAVDLRRIIQTIVAERAEWPDIGSRFHYHDGVAVSTRVHNCLLNLKLNSWAEVDQHRDRLLHTYNLGRVSYQEISDILVSRGFRPLRKWATLLPTIASR